MVTKISNLLKKYATSWLVLLLLAGEVFFNTVVFPKQHAKMEAVSGSTRPIDTQFFYNPEQVYSMVESYGEAGRAAYRAFELTADIVYPIVYTLFLVLAITWLFQRGFTPNSMFQNYNVVPFGTWLFDLLENLSIVAMLSIYPATPPALAWVSAVFTSVKWLFAGASILLLLTGLVVAWKNGFRKQT